MSLPVIGQKVVAEEKEGSPGLALVKLDFLIGTNRGSNSRSQDNRRHKGRNSDRSKAKSLRNKYFTSKSLFPKDLAGNSR